MANICNNELRVYSENPKNLEYIMNFFSENWHYFDLDEVDEENITITFESKWDFPETKMIEMVKNLPDKENINMTCLSVEWGCLYSAFHYYQDGRWNYE